MRTMPSGLAIFAAAMLALGIPAVAQGSQSGATKSSAPTHRHKPPSPDAWAAPGSAHSRQDDCPNGDCRGLNSPGNMGGSHGDF
jgi:hypothetical protein